LSNQAGYLQIREGGNLIHFKFRNSPFNPLGVNSSPFPQNATLAFVTVLFNVWLKQRTFV